MCFDCHTQAKLWILQNSSHLLWNTALALTLRLKTQSCLSPSRVSIVIPFFVLDKFDFYFWNPLWLPGLLPQLILLIMSHFPLHSWAESAFSLLSAHCWIVFFFMAAFTLHQLLKSQSIVPTFTIHLFSFLNKRLPNPFLPCPSSFGGILYMYSCSTPLFFLLNTPMLQTCFKPEFAEELLHSCIPEMSQGAPGL